MKSIVQLRKKLGVTTGLPNEQQDTPNLSYSEGEEAEGKILSQSVAQQYRLGE